METLAAVVGSVAGKFAEYTLEPIQRQFGYLIPYNSNVQRLTEEVKKLDDQINEVQQLVDAAERNLQVPMPAVRTWLMKAHQTSQEIDQFLSVEAARAGNGRCPDLKLRYSVNRKAKKKTPIVVQLTQDSSFPADQIARSPALPPRLVPTLTTAQGFQDFESRVIIMDEVVEALKDDTVNMICICGVGGVGKTTMANKIVNRVKEEKLFDEVAMAVVSQRPDPEKIRDSIADQLGLKLDEQSEEGRAAQLHRRIVKINKFLLVLDDVWDDELQFEKIGLPLGSGYKILVTSRRRDVLLTSSGIFRYPITFVVLTLTEEEAWSLFKESAGYCIEDPDISSVARQVVRECRGLPLAIVVVGSTLQNAGSNEAEWREALRKLKRDTYGNTLLSCIKLSYVYLKCEEHQSFFLLCCLFPEDADIPIESLLRYGMGLGLLTKENYSFQEARNRVRALVDKLSRLFLLLDSKLPGHVKMHDVVRDVGISLASEDKENGLMNTCKCYQKSDEVLEEDLAKLKLLRLSELESDISMSFFEGILLEKLNVLALSNEIDYDFGEQPKLWLPPLSFCGLQNIQTLCLENYNLKNIDISEIGALVTLEILSFKGSSGVRSLRSELGLLSRLRLLDCRCYQPDRIQSQIGRFATIPELIISYGVLSGLKQLEELYFGNIRVVWEVEDEGKELVNASLAEFSCLSKLTTLTITLPSAHLINPKHLICFGNLVNFQINMGCENTWLEENNPFPNCLFMSLQVEERMDHHTASLLHTLRNTIEILYVEGRLMTYISSKVEEIHEPSGSSFILVRADWTKLLQNLRVLEVGSCHSIEVLFGIEKLENATNTILPLLEELYLYDLPKLKHVWQNSALASQGFQALKILKVRDCRNMKQIVGEGEEEENKKRAVSVAYILFPQLVKLHFYRLQNLMSIFSGNIYTLDWMSMEEIVLDDTPHLKTFSSGVVDHIIT